MRQSSEHLDRNVSKRVTLDYLAFVPGGDPPAGGWPLLLFLHGAGERGDDLERVASYGPPRLVETGHDLPFVIVSPQCPAHSWWAEQLDALGCLLDEAAERFPIDPDRVYATGLSMGGEGVWSLAATMPERFAAIAPICGFTDPGRAPRHALLPTWAFHGSDDPVVDVRHSRDMIRALELAGGSPILTLYEGVGHNSWDRAYSPETGLFAWLLERRRPPRPAPD